MGVGSYGRRQNLKLVFLGGWSWADGQTKGKKTPPPFWAGDCKDAQRLFRQTKKKEKNFPPFGLKDAQRLFRQTNKKEKNFPPFGLPKDAQRLFRQTNKGEKIPPFWAGDCKERQTHKGEKTSPLLGWRLQRAPDKKFPPFWAGDCKERQTDKREKNFSPFGLAIAKTLSVFSPTYFDAQRLPGKYSF